MSLFRRVLLTALFAAAFTATLSAGFWQLRRLKARRANNTVLMDARNRSPLLLDREHAAQTIDSGRRVTARGTFIPAEQIALRGRIQNDGPGLQIVTPFVVDGSSRTVWVLRGFVSSPDAVTIPGDVAVPDTGTVTISGLALAAPATTDSGAPLQHDGQTTWKRLDQRMLEARRPGSYPVYLILEGGEKGPGHLAAIAPPELSDGPHFSYALQWFGMALAIATFAAVTFWRGGRAPSPRHEAP